METGLEGIPKDRNEWLELSGHGKLRISFYGAYYPDIEWKMKIYNRKNWKNNY